MRIETVYFLPKPSLKHLRVRLEGQADTADRILVQSLGDEVNVCSIRFDFQPSTPVQHELKATKVVMHHQFGLRFRLIGYKFFPSIDALVSRHITSKD
ncbi:hypothetical protein EVAR_20403_1 [Eumeta japonica]|uniref:Uncharacterized protein n=1 Tax=Eumeta variegata TaxID=151549 RepID=A0A4C1TXU2_EUMVA|nr:hypothetical protein EVAR_20403_1 [Eumeta japonica]